MTVLILALAVVALAITWHLPALVDAAEADPSLRFKAAMLSVMYLLVFLTTGVLLCVVGFRFILTGELP